MSAFAAVLPRGRVRPIPERARFDRRTTSEPLIRRGTSSMSDCGVTTFRKTIGFQVVRPSVVHPSPYTGQSHGVRTTSPMSAHDCHNMQILTIFFLQRGPKSNLVTGPPSIPLSSDLVRNTRNNSAMFRFLVPDTLGECHKRCDSPRSVLPSLHCVSQDFGVSSEVPLHETQVCSRGQA